MLQLEVWRKEDYEYNSLVRLKITNCPNLRELPPHFINLQVLKIKGCNSLKSLPLTPSLRFLILLDNLVLEHWNEVVLVSDQEQFLPSFINVIELTIKNCPTMPGLPKVFAPQKLLISGCPSLTTLPNPEFSRRFQHLALDGCVDGTLVNSIPNTDSLYSLVISNISNLISLPQLPSLPGLKTLYIHHCQHLQSLSQGEASHLLGLKSLTLLSIRDCPKLVALPQAGLPSALEYLSIESCNALEVLGPNDALQNLTSLKDLYIENCPSLRSLPEDGVPTSLRHLRIQGCPLLEQECRKDSPQWPKIMHIPDLECDFLDQVSSPQQSKNSKKKSWTTSIYRGFSRSKGKQKQGESSY